MSKVYRAKSRAGLGIAVSGAALVGLSMVAPAAAQVPMGRASNLSDGMHHEARPVMVEAATQTVLFVHPQDVTIWGGGGNANGRFRYDVSLDGGRTFRNDIGVLQAEYRARGRHPSGALSRSGDALRLTWQGATLAPDDTWHEQVNGTTVVSIDAPPISTERYVFGADEAPAHIPGSMAKGAPGQYWSIGFEDPSEMNPGTLSVYRGHFDEPSQDVDWQVAHRTVPAYRNGSPSPRMWSPRVAFSPDGSVGWVSFLADLTDVPMATGGRRPVMARITDNGATLEPLRSIDLSTVPLVSRGGTEENVVDRLRSEGALAPQPTVTHQSDLAVDGDGNPHLVLGLAAVLPFDELGADLVSLHLLVDLTSTDGGTTWRMLEIAPLRTHRGTAGNFPTVTYGNEPHVARDATGEHVFFSWIDSNGSNLGVEPLPANIAPDLNVAALRVRDQSRTAPRNVTENNLVWSGRIIHPQMATEVLARDGQWRLPVVSPELLSGETTQPIQFHYFGDLATVPMNAFGEMMPPDPDAGVADDMGAPDEGVADAGVDAAEAVDLAVDDAEISPDAAIPDAANPDAANPDAQIRADASNPDAGALDGAISADAAAPNPDLAIAGDDAGAQPDGGTRRRGGGDGGCQTNASNHPTSFGFLGLALLGLMRRRRR